MDIEILSLFPGYFSGPFDHSILKRAQENGLVSIRQTDIRDFCHDKHRTADDRPYGGGPGMLMKAQPVVEAIRNARREKSRVIYLSPQGRPLDVGKCKELAKLDHLVFLCGHYEGIDQRAIDLEVDEEVSIGDYVLTNGCLAAIVTIDALLRFVPGVLGNVDTAEQDSFSNGVLDCPHYTRPEEFEGMKVPQVLLSGNHSKIEKWRQEIAEKNTKEKRPDLIDPSGKFFK